MMNHRNAWPVRRMLLTATAVLALSAATPASAEPPMELQAKQQLVQRPHASPLARTAAFLFRGGRAGVADLDRAYSTTRQRILGYSPPDAPGEPGCGVGFTSWQRKAVREEISARMRVSHRGRTIQKLQRLQSKLGGVAGRWIQARLNRLLPEQRLDQRVVRFTDNMRTWQRDHGDSFYHCNRTFEGSLKARVKEAQSSYRAQGHATPRAAAVNAVLARPRFGGGS